MVVCVCVAFQLNAEASVRTFLRHWRRSILAIFGPPGRAPRTTALLSKPDVIRPPFDRPMMTQSRPLLWARLASIGRNLRVRFNRAYL